MDIVRIRINNWDKYHPSQARKLKSPWWVALSNRITQDAEVWALNDGEFRVWIAMLCYASLKGKAEFTLPVATFLRQNDVSLKHFNTLLEKAQSFQWILLIVDDSSTNRSLKVDAHNKTRQNKTRQDPTAKAVVSTEASKARSVDPPVQLHGFEVKKTIFNKWCQTYDKEWVETEILKASTWCEANPSRRPKSNFVRFLNSWMERGWERHRKTLPASKVKRTAAEMMAETDRRLGHEQD